MREYEKTFQIFAIFGTLPLMTIAVFVRETPSGLEYVILSGMFIVHITTFVFLLTAIFILKHERTKLMGKIFNVGLKISAFISAVLWVIAIVVTLIIGNKRGILTPEWV
jgi:heme/copper-type cytochrome/quinol oxidase subunit 2